MLNDMRTAAPTPVNLYDRRAERAYAAGIAEQQRANAEALRADTALRLRQAERAEAREDAAERDRIRRTRSYQWKTWRSAKAATIRRSAVRFAPILAGGVAMGAPIVLAWSGQLAFGSEVMLLGQLAFVVPVALEGAVWYVAYLVHRAAELGLPTGVYRAWAWALAAIAAAMNFWHGATQAGGAQRGAVLALASLLGVGLWELTVRLRERKQRGRSAADLRTAMARRLRYPVLTFAAWSIRIARGPACTVEEAWTAAWERRYGVAPGEDRTVRTEPDPVRRAYVFRTVRTDKPRTVRRTFTFRPGARTEEPRTVRLARTFAFRTGPAVEPVRTIRRAFTFQAGAPRTEPEPVREPARTEPDPVLADKDTFVRTITGEILAAADRGDEWGPDYAELMARTGRSKSWCEKAVRTARTGLFRTEVAA